MPCGCGMDEDNGTSTTDNGQDNSSQSPFCVKCFTFWLIVAFLAFLSLRKK